MENLIYYIVWLVIIPGVIYGLHKWKQNIEDNAWIEGYNYGYGDGASNEKAYLKHEIEQLRKERLSA